MATLHHFSEIVLLPEGSEFTDSKGESFRKVSNRYNLFNSSSGYSLEMSEIELPVTVDSVPEDFFDGLYEDVWLEQRKFLKEPRREFGAAGSGGVGSTVPKMSVEETRTVSATGGQKGKKDEELGAVDPTALRILARVAAFGGKKYERSNYLKGYNWSLSFDALQRHALAFWEGEDLDPESGLPHSAHMSWHALALTSFLTRGLGTDDRFKQ